jgi:hypothetical protein
MAMHAADVSAAKLNGPGIQLLVFMFCGTFNIQLQLKRNLLFSKFTM